MSKEIGAPEKLPVITHLQFLVLCKLTGNRELAGGNLRVMLMEEGVKSSGPQFYQMMSRLEDSGYVEGWYAPKEIEHQVVNERRYRMTGKGRSARENTIDFYARYAKAKPE